jgi:hypothetical protein
LAYVRGLWDLERGYNGVGDSLDVLASPSVDGNGEGVQLRLDGIKVLEGDGQCSVGIDTARVHCGRYSLQIARGVQLQLRLDTRPGCGDGMSDQYGLGTLPALEVEHQ